MFVFTFFTFLPLSQLSVIKFETTAIAVYGADNESFIVVLFTVYCSLAPNLLVLIYNLYLQTP